MTTSKIGIIICDCHGAISDKVNVDYLVDSCLKMKNVVFVERVDALCNKKALSELIEKMNKRNIDRFLFAGCSPRSSLRFPESQIARLLSKTSCDPNLSEVANIREQCAWLHEACEATDKKALDEIKMAYARLNLDSSLPGPVKIEEKALIIGGGPAGLACAKDLAGLDREVTIVEKGNYLGGRLCQIRILFQTENWNGKCINLCVGPVQSHGALFQPTVTAYTQAEILNIRKIDGNFHATIKQSPQYVDMEKCIACGKCSVVCKEFGHNNFNEGLFVRKAIDKDFSQAVPDAYNIMDKYCTKCGECVSVCPSDAIDLDAKETIIKDIFGTVLISTGFDFKDLSKYPEYSSLSANVISGMELERMFDHKVICPSNNTAPEKITFVLCAGSRATDEKISGGVPYCSKICCGATMKQAIQLAQTMPEIEITIIYYYDIRTYERTFEDLYDTVKRIGVEFVQGNLETIDENDDHSLTLTLSQLGEQKSSSMEEYVYKDGKLTIDTDLVVLASAQTPKRSNDSILSMLQIPKDQFGFPIENQPRIFRPTETFVDRVYVAGTATGPKVVQQAVEQGKASAMNAIPHLIKGEKTPVKYISSIDPERCVSCRFCETVCPHGAISFTESGMTLDPGFCQGCGLCQAACPSVAANLINFSDAHILEQVKVAFSGVNENDPKILALLCYWCSYCGADLAGREGGFTLPSNFRTIKIRCSSSVNTTLIVEMFRRGVDGILIGGCPPNSCHHLHGNYLADKRISLCNLLMRQMGLDSNRLRFDYIGVPHSKKFVETILSMDNILRRLGPNPVGLINKEAANG